MTALPLATRISYQLGWPLRVIGIAGSLALLILILELVRRRQLKEEYTVLWVLTGAVLLLLAAWEELLRRIAEAIGASSEASMLYFFGLIFVVFLLLHFSVRVSRLERRVLSLVQEIALLGAGGAHNGAAVAASGGLAHQAAGGPAQTQTEARAAAEAGADAKAQAEAERRAPPPAQEAASGPRGPHAPAPARYEGSAGPRPSSRRGENAS